MTLLAVSYVAILLDSADNRMHYTSNERVFEKAVGYMCIEVYEHLGLYDSFKLLFYTIKIIYVSSIYKVEDNWQ